MLRTRNPALPRLAVPETTKQMGSNACPFSPHSLHLVTSQINETRLSALQDLGVYKSNTKRKMADTTEYNFLGAGTFAYLTATDAYPLWSMFSSARVNSISMASN
jgi:hypothetical protein